jgi:hypothetical protein
MDAGGPPDLMTLFYAAVTSVQDGHIGEVEFQHSTDDHNAGTVITVTVYVRRDPMVITVATGD